MADWITRQLILLLAACVCAAACGCRCRREPSCLPVYQGRAIKPVDASGSFPTPHRSAADLNHDQSPQADADPGSDDQAQVTQPDRVRPDSAVKVAGGSAQFVVEQLPPIDAAASQESVPRGAGPFALPRDLPGATAPPLVVPPFESVNDAARNETLREQLGPAPPVAGSPPGPSERTSPGPQEPLDLSRLQTLALANNPSIAVAAAQVEQARGRVIQAGAWPNPTLGYEADTVNTLYTAGYHGAYVQQTFVTAGKLRLAQSAAEVDLCNAVVGLRRARIDVATKVRRAYFAALIAQEKLRITSRFAEFSERTYEAQIRRVEAGEAAPYEPLQLRVAVAQSRAAVVGARQSYDAALRQLAAALGLPELGTTAIIGRADAPPPPVGYEAALGTINSRHTEIIVSRNDVAKARWELQLARVTPRPNIDTYLAVQHDSTFNPGTTTVNLQVGGPIAVFDRNTGNIISAQARVSEAQRHVEEVENDLAARLADAYSRYESARRQVQEFQKLSLEDQSRAYQGIADRYLLGDEGINFNDVLTAQQALSSLLMQHLDLLAAQWTAVVDIAELTQLEDVFQLGGAFPTGGQAPAGEEAQGDAPLAPESA